MLMSKGIYEISIDDPADMEDILNKKNEYGWDYIDDGLKTDLGREPSAAVYFEDTPENRQKVQDLKIEVMKLKDSEIEGRFGSEADLGRLYAEDNIVDDNDWKDKWKEFFKPSRVTDRIVVKPTWEDYQKEGDELVLEIDPGMAFGTGTHETTSLCMKLMEKYLGDDAYWESTQQALRDVLEEKGVDYVEAEGEAAFYGPKIDVQAKNVYGKEDTMCTIQLDCAIAENFDMYYIDQNGEKIRPYIIHRTSLGCYERTLAWLIEHYAGKFPTWMCPEQVRVLPISDKYEAYANQVYAELKKNGIDVTVDARSEKIGYKIREARLDKLPYMLVVGQQEEADGTVSVRSRFAGDEGVKSLADFIAAITEEIRTKEIRKEIPMEERK